MEDNCLRIDNFVDVDRYLPEIEEYTNKFVFYRRGYTSPVIDGFDLFSEKRSKTTDCYCTACHTRYEDNANDPKIYKHKTMGTCHNCGSRVEYRQMNKGRQTYCAYGNFAVFEGAGDLMRIACIKIYQRFEDDQLEPTLSWSTITRYELRPGKAVQYKFNWEKGWIPKVSKALEPNFATGFYWRDSCYTLINHDCTDKSFLNYFIKTWQGDYPGLYIQWLCRYAEHPQIEYFLHGGLSHIAKCIVSSSLGKDIRPNWKSNDLKKILRVSKPELEYLKNYDGIGYDDYIRWRRSFWNGKTPEETIKYFDLFKNCRSYIKRAEMLTGLSRKKIMDYVLRKQNSEGTLFFMIQYKDYLEECRKLNYDMSSEAVIMPKNLFTAHERTSRILRDMERKAIKEQMELANEKRRDMEVTDLELGLILRLPGSVEEIAEEGAKLNHCVGGYASRHAAGATTILFLRDLGHPFTPYYTMEVDNSLKIVQCRGYGNNRRVPKPEEIFEFEKRYAEYLESVKLMRKKAKKKAQRSTRKQSKAATAA